MTNTIYENKFEESERFLSTFDVTEGEHSVNYIPAKCKVASIDSNNHRWKPLLAIYNRLNKRSGSFTLPERHNIYSDFVQLMKIQMPESVLTIWCESNGQGYKAIKFKYI